jgi:hypothetical protein
MLHVSMRRTFAIGALPLALSVLAACTSADNGERPKSALDGQTRDTAIKHEPCDGTSASAVKVDVKGNGKPAIIHVMSGSREVCRILDLNMDGAPDAFIYYDEQGRERRREQDFDRDGRADEITIFENGQIKLKMRETNFDNKIDTWDYYENGRLVKRERDSDGDGIVDQWWTFNNPANPKCAVVAVDRNADGKPDPDSVVDLCSDSYGTPKAAPAASATPSASPSAAPSSKPSAPGTSIPTPAPPPAASGVSAAVAPGPPVTPPPAPPVKK